MSIRLLRTFVAISETGSFAGAAQKVCITQAAVSQQMKRLEELVETPLFERALRSPQMTQSGRAMVPQARDIIQRYDQMVAAVSSKSAIVGDLRIGAVPSVMGQFVPPALKLLKTKFPGVHIRVVPSLSSDLLAQIERGFIDAAVMSKPPRVKASFKWLPLIKEPVMLAVSSDVDGDDARSILLSQPYLCMAQGAWISVVADEILDAMGLSLVDAMELDSLETIASMVAHNLGVALMPKPSVGVPDNARIRYLPIPEGQWFREIGVLSRADNGAYPITEAFHGALLDVVQRS